MTGLRVSDLSGPVFIAVCVALVAAGNARHASAQQAGPAAKAGAAAHAADQVDTKTSRIYVRVGKRRLGHEHGVEGQVKEGTLRLGAPNDAGEIVFDMATFVADTDASRKYVRLESTIEKKEQDEVTETMRGAGVLDVKAHPTAKFKMTSATLLKEKSADGKPQYQLDGAFTLRGATKPLKVTAQAAEEKDGKVRLKGQFAVKQTDYGIKPYSAVGGIVAVADELKIWGDLWVAKP